MPPLIAPTISGVSVRGTVAARPGGDRAVLVRGTGRGCQVPIALTSSV